jgi:hypothetical protein
VPEVRGVVLGLEKIPLCIGIAKLFRPETSRILGKSPNVIASGTLPST